MGLILIIKFRSVKRISEEFSIRDQSALNHFITDSVWEHRQLILRSQEIVRVALGSKPLQLVIDDTALERRGSKIECTGVHYGSNRLVKGHCLVSAAVISGKRRYMWDCRGYAPKGASAACRFKSKVRIAVEIIEESEFEAGDVTVMVDCWYTNRDVAGAVKARGWRFLAGVKKNRIVYVRGRRSRVSNLAKGQRKYEKVKCGRHVFRAARVLAFIPGIGEVSVFVVKSGSLGTRYLICSDTELSAREAVLMYAKRFWIETQFREVKQHFGLGEMFIRKWRGAQKHWALVMVAYNVTQMLRYSARGKRFETVGAVLRRLRDEFSRVDVKRFTAVIAAKAA